MTNPINSRQWVAALPFLILLLPSLLTSCSDNEDTTPSLADQNIFVPADNDQSETAQIRRNFFNQTGSYLLFSDTLLTVTAGTSADGTLREKTELLAPMGYSMVGFGSSTHYYYDYIVRPDSQRVAAELVRQHLVRRLGKAQPYAYMLVNGIAYYRNNTLTPITKLLGTRAYVISLPGEAYTTPDTYFRSMLNDMVSTKVKSMSDDELASFLQYSHSYYYQDEDKFGLKTTKSTDEEMWAFGFFTDVHYDIFPTQPYDVEDWLKAVLTYSREQFETTYGSSLMMMNKYDAMRSIIVDDLGYVLD